MWSCLTIPPALWYSSLSLQSVKEPQRQMNYSTNKLAGAPLARLLLSKPASAHLFPPIKYIVIHPDVSWLKPQKARRWSAAKRWYFHGWYRRSMSVRWYLSWSSHLHLKKKIWREKKHKDPSCRWQDIPEKKMKRKEIRRTVVQVLRYNVRTTMQVMMSDWRCSFVCALRGRKM